MNSNINLNNFLFNNRKIFVILDENNKPWFRGIDIAEILEYSNPIQTVINLDINDRVKQEILKPLTYDERNAIYINEMGLYSLILFSKKEIAKIFKKWIVHEVLPTIDKYQEYKLYKEIMKKILNNLTNQLKFTDDNITQLEKEIKEKEKDLQLLKETKLVDETCYNKIQSLQVI